MSEQHQFVRLNDLDAFYSGREAKSYRLGGLNGPGGVAWWGVEGTLVCFTLKTFVFFGPIRLHALRVRGFVNEGERVDLFGAPDRPEGLPSYAWRCLKLLVWGMPFGRVGTELKLLKDPKSAPGRSAQQAGRFSLVPTEGKA